MRTGVEFWSTISIWLIGENEYSLKGRYIYKKAYARNPPKNSYFQSNLFSDCTLNRASNLPSWHFNLQMYIMNAVQSAVSKPCQDECFFHKTICQNWRCRANSKVIELKQIKTFNWSMGKAVKIKKVQQSSRGNDMFIVLVISPMGEFRVLIIVRDTCFFYF